jgi:hypothetical protein
MTRELREDTVRIEVNDMVDAALTCYTIKEEHLPLALAAVMRREAPEHV